MGGLCYTRLACSYALDLRRCIISHVLFDCNSGLNVDTLSFAVCISEGVGSFHFYINSFWGCVFRMLARRHLCVSASADVCDTRLSSDIHLHRLFDMSQFKFELCFYT